MSKLCIVMVGLPGLGKSTVIQKFQQASAQRYFVYSTDDYISEVASSKGLTYDEVFQDEIGTATEVVNQRLDGAIKNGTDVIWDQTNLGVKKRSRIINRMKQAGYRVECLTFLHPTEEPGLTEWNDRLRQRSLHEGKTIPSHVVKNMADSYVVPDVSEGFVSVRHINMWGQEIHPPG